MKCANIPDAGRGLFASRKFAAGELVTGMRKKKQTNCIYIKLTSITGFDGELVNQVHENVRELSSHCTAWMRTLMHGQLVVDGRGVPPEKVRLHYEYIY